MEQRNFKRFNISIEALVLLPHEVSMKMTTINISDGGVFFDTKIPLPLGTEVLMSFSNAKSVKRWVKPLKIDKIKGTVCRVDHYGSAICFREQQEFSRYIVTETSSKLRVLAPF